MEIANPTTDFNNSLYPHIANIYEFSKIRYSDEAILATPKKKLDAYHKSWFFFEKLIKNIIEKEASEFECMESNPHVNIEDYQKNYIYVRVMSRSRDFDGGGYMFRPEYCPKFYRNQPHTINAEFILDMNTFVQMDDDERVTCLKSYLPNIERKYVLATKADIEHNAKLIKIIMRRTDAEFKIRDLNKASKVESPAYFKAVATVEKCNKQMEELGFKRPT